MEAYVDCIIFIKSKFLMRMSVLLNRSLINTAVRCFGKGYVFTTCESKKKLKKFMGREEGTRALTKNQVIVIFYKKKNVICCV